MSPCFKFGSRGHTTYPPLDQYRAHKEVHFYKPIRIIGYLCSIAALAFGLYHVINRTWIHYKPADTWLGLWEQCYEGVLQGIVTTNDISSGSCKITIAGVENLPKWQSAIIGLLLFSLAAGLFASFLTTWGVCATSLARKVYFYHSAGEIFLICGICSTAALITYPAVLESSAATPKHEYGMGYFLGWVMPVFYFVSALCMTLDDMIHSVTNDCCILCRRRNVKGQKLTTVPV